MTLKWLWHAFMVTKNTVQLNSLKPLTKESASAASLSWPQISSKTGPAMIKDRNWCIYIYICIYVYIYIYTYVCRDYDINDVLSHYCECKLCKSVSIRNGAVWFSSSWPLQVQPVGDGKTCAQIGPNPQLIHKTQKSSQDPRIQRWFHMISTLPNEVQLWTNELWTEQLSRGLRDECDSFASTRASRIYRWSWMFVELLCVSFSLVSQRFLMLYQLQDWSKHLWKLMFFPR